MSTTYSGTAGLLQLVQQEAAIGSTGSCSSHSDPDLWHREDQSDSDYCQGCTADAVSICQTCPIQSWCDTKAVGETSGVWAGRPRSEAVDARRVEGHTCPGQRKARNAARVRAWRAKQAAGDLPLTATG